MPKRITISLSDDLAEAAELLRRRQKYRTASEYIAGLIRYDGQSQREHHLSAEWAALSGYERDRLDKGILRQVKSKKGVRGSWLEATIEEIVKRQLAAGVTPTVQTVVPEIATEIIARDGTPARSQA